MSLNSTPPKLSPTKGKRSSTVFRNSALPPIGKPVSGSRGPAWKSGKARFDNAPPPKNLSANGISGRPE